MTFSKLPLKTAMELITRIFKIFYALSNETRKYRIIKDILFGYYKKSYVYYAKNTTFNT